MEIVSLNPKVCISDLFQAFIQVMLMVYDEQ
jgi:hypothetical protein